MPHLHPRIWAAHARLNLLIASLVIAAGSAWMQTLVERSPFLPPDFGKPSVPQESATAMPASVQHLRFKGVFALRGTVKVNLFNTKTKKGTWVPLNGMIDGHRVVAYDSQQRAVDLEVDGKITRFDLVTPSDSPIPVTTAPRTAVTSRSTARSRSSSSTSPSVRRRTIVPPRPSTRSNSQRATSTNSRTNRRTVVRPGQTGSTNNQQPPTSRNSRRTNSDNASSTTNNRTTTPRQPRQLPQ